nr:hypothetical protein [Natronococcus pandeyae]
MTATVFEQLCERVWLDSLVQRRERVEVDLRSFVEVDEVPRDDVASPS